MPPHTCRVLIVDDVEDSAITLSIMVKRMGHVAKYVVDPRQAIATAKEFAPELVLLDIGMPHINGYDLAPLLRQALAPRKVPIIAVTAWGSQKDRDHSRALGFVEHILKPPPMDMVRDTIERFCAPAGA